MQSAFNRTSVHYKTILCLLLFVLADFLFYDEPIGWTAGLFGFVLLVTRYGYSTDQYPSLKIVISLLTLGQCFALAWQFSFLSILLMLLGLISLALLHDARWHNDARVWCSRMLHFMLRFIGRIFADKRILARIRRSGKAKKMKETMLRGWVLPIIATLVFLGLFSNANPLIEEWLWKINWNKFWGVFEFGRIVFWFIMLCFIWALLRGRLKAKTRKQPVQAYSRNGVIAWLFSPDAIFRSLVLFNLLFAVQTSMDMLYLWGGMTLPDNMTFARYAQHGAYPLIITALLAAAFVLIVFRDEEGYRPSQTIRKMVYIWIAQNIMLVISSIMRTLLYVEHYSLTYMRVAALIWMGLVAVGLFLIILRILHQKSNLWLINSNAIMLISTLYICGFLPFGELIAHYNVRHSHEVSGNGRHLDEYYLYRIGPEVLPALEWFVNNAKTNPKKIKRVQDYQNQLAQKLWKKHSRWRSWTFQQHRLAQDFCPKNSEWNFPCTQQGK